MLTVDMQVNGQSIGKLYATNRERRPIGPDPTCTYSVLIVDSEGVQHPLTVRHRRNDGAWALVAAALMEYL